MSDLVTIETIPLVDMLAQCMKDCNQMMLEGIKDEELAKCKETIDEMIIEIKLRLNILTAKC